MELTTERFALEITANKPEPAGSKKAFVVKTKSGKMRAVIVDDNSKSKPWQAIIKRLAAEELGTNFVPWTGAVRFAVAYFLPRPQGHYRSDGVSPSKAATEKPYPTSKPDVLKLTRGVEDALTGILYADDSQICDERIVKIYGGGKVHKTIIIASKIPPEQDYANRMIDDLMTRGY